MVISSKKLIQVIGSAYLLLAIGCGAPSKVPAYKAPDPNTNTKEKTKDNGDDDATDDDAMHTGGSKKPSKSPSTNDDGFEQGGDTPMPGNTGDGTPTGDNGGGTTPTDGTGTSGGTPPPPAPTEPSIGVINVCTDLVKDYNVLNSSGISMKLFDAMSGVEKYALNSAEVTAATKKAIVERKSVPANFTKIADGFYMMGLCNDAYHMSCKMTVDDAKKWNDIINAQSGQTFVIPQYTNGLVGAVPYIEVKGGVMIGTPKGATFLAVTNGSTACDRNLQTAPAPGTTRPAFW